MFLFVCVVVVVLCVCLCCYCCVGLFVCVCVFKVLLRVRCLRMLAVLTVCCLLLFSFFFAFFPESCGTRGTQSKAVETEMTPPTKGVESRLGVCFVSCGVRGAVFLNCVVVLFGVLCLFACLFFAVL